MTTNITVTKETKITANGTHTSKNCKPTAKIDKFGNLTIYASSIDAAKKNNLLASDLSKYIARRKTHKGDMYCFVSELPEQYDYMMGKQSVTSEKVAGLEAKAAAYDAIMAEREAERKAKEALDAEISKTEAKLAHRREIRARIEAELKKAIEREMETESYLNELKGKEV